MRSLSRLIAANLMIAAVMIVAEAQIARTPWPASTPSREGLSPGKLEEMLAWMRGSGDDFRSLVIVKNGKLVASVGLGFFEPETPQNLYSATKSFLSTLIGIATREGLFPPLASRVSGFLTEYNFGGPGDPRRAITFEQLLTQSSGFPPVWAWDYGRVVETVPYVLYRKLVAEPGASFIYNSGTLNILSAALQKATGMKSSEYSREKLLDPMGIDDWAWEEDGAGVTTGGTNFCASAIDLAKLGYLYLRGGEWFGTRLVEPEWIAAATAARFAPTGMNRAEACGYGYLWWIDEWGGYSAHGAGGNFCFVLPRYDMVVVITAGLPDDKFPLPYDLMKRYILPAAEEGGKAGSDPAGDAAFAELAADGGPHAMGPTFHPPIAYAIGNLRFACEPNPLALDWFELDFAEPDRVRVTTQGADAEEGPRSFVAGAVGPPSVTMGADWGMAATVAWEGEKSLRLTLFDMRAIIDIGIAFDGRGNAAVRASSPAYDIDASWQASSR